VIRLGRQDAGRGLQKGFILDQRRGALVRGDADVFEDEGAEQEVFIAGIRIEGHARAHQAGRARGARERAIRIGAADVECRLRHCRSAKRRAQEADVGDFILRDFFRILRHQRVLERHLAPSRDRALGAGAADQTGRQANAEHGVRVELGFQVFQVEGEIEDVDIGRLRRLGHRILDRTAAGAQESAAHQADAHATHVLEERTPLFQLFLTRIQ